MFKNGVYHAWMNVLAWCTMIYFEYGTPNANAYTLAQTFSAKKTFGRLASKGIFRTKLCSSEQTVTGVLRPPNCKNGLIALMSRGRTSLNF